MKTRVQKWGNSLALRIPKSLAEEAGLRANGAVELSLVDGGLVVQPVAPQPPTLEELLRGVTDDNMPGEWDTGRPPARRSGEPEGGVHPGTRRRRLDHPRSASGS